MKNVITIVFLIIPLILFIMLTFWVRSNYFNIKNDNIKITNYSEYYNVESIIYNYMDKLKNIEKEYNLFSDINTSSSNISKKKAREIRDIYGLEKYLFIIEIKDVVKLSNNQYKCEYMFKHDTMIMRDGEAIREVEATEKKEFSNSLIVEVKDNKFKVLYTKLDLGDGIYYEK